MAAGFFCRSCGHESLRWEGRCPACGDWNTLVEAPAGAGKSRDRFHPTGRSSVAAPLREAVASEAGRLLLDIGDLDLVLGGGLVSGSVVLLGGSPGIGKSTLLLQAAASVQRTGGSALYVSGEESAPQVRLRAERIGGAALDVTFFGATGVEEVLRVAHSARPDFLGVDSIQTLSSEAADSAPGTVSQVRECTAALQAFAKLSGTPVVIVGHVTKQGSLAGPRTLEHVVDAVLQLEGSRGREHRLLRATKNRFGSVDEIAVFRMTGAGLAPVDNPSEVFLSQAGGVSGSAVAVTFQGSRPLLAEVQCLTARSRFGIPQRTTSGFPPRRLALLLAVLERRAGVQAIERDVFVNVVGGLRLSDPAADLAVAAALVSAELERTIGSRAIIGEVGLGGEVRAVPRLERRLAEARKLGIEEAIVPATALPATVTHEAAGAAGAPQTLRLVPVSHVRELVERIA
ncbi:MAG: DNA repair protein RadA [Gemmatimonadota bacterium]